MKNRLLSKVKTEDRLFLSVKNVVEQARNFSYRSLNFASPKLSLLFMFYDQPSNRKITLNHDLEKAIIGKLEKFLLELGKGFFFVARQKRITINEKHYRIDLVFWQRHLQCFVLIDLKIGEVSTQDIGQMQMYVNYYDRDIRHRDEKKTIGIILCKEKDDKLVRITLPENNKQIFTSKFRLYFPKDEELQQVMEDAVPYHSSLNNYREE